MSTFRVTLLVGVFFLSLYLLTSGGHTSSPDEESMYFVTQSMVSHFGLDVPVGTGTTGAQAVLGVDGKEYAPYGLVPSIMAVPFYLFGAEVGRLAPSPFDDYIKRLFVCFLDSFVTAATCCLVFLFSRKLRYPPKVSLLVALAFGVSTIAWPYSKHFHSEPVTGLWLVLAVYAAFVGVRSQSRTWLFLAGFALGLSVGSKVSTAVVVPGMLTYVAMFRSAERGCPFRKTVEKLLAFGLGLAVIGVAILFLNDLRFGNPFQTGYQAVASPATAFQPFVLHGIAGLLVSPGKSVFIYSPIALASLFTLRSFWSRFPLETLLFAFIVGSHVLLYGLLTFWHGDASWGPRYLVPITAFFVLPVGAALSWADLPWRPLAWKLFSITFAVGLLVQLGGVLFNYDTYTIATGGTSGLLSHERRWNPTMSPVLAHWGLLFEGVSQIHQWNRPDVLFGSGLYGPEGPHGAQFPRWTAGDAIFDIPIVHSLDIRLVLTYVDMRPPQLGPANLDVVATGPGIIKSFVTKTFDNGQWIVVDNIRFQARNEGPLTVSVLTSTWIPAQVGPSPDHRVLGVDLRNVQVVDGDRMLTVGPPFVSPIPVSVAQPWSREAWAWFYGASHQIFDLWMWDWYFSGLSRSVLVMLIVPLGALVVSGTMMFRWAVSGSTAVEIVPPPLEGAVAGSTSIATDELI